MASSYSWISCTLLMALCLASSAAGWRRELTTRAWDVLGFHENAPHSPLEDQIIVAVVDHGIWPESPSFDDKGLGPPPAKWKGICDSGNSSIPFKCNNKIIGARYYPHKDLDFSEYPNEDRSPRDTNGHGTHVAATIAGVPVKNVSMEGIGLGTARGAVPRARIAVYKVCWVAKCPQTTAAVAIIDAIKDGADIISLSLASWPFPFEKDVMAYPSFAAMRQGIFISLAAGNNDTLNSFTVNGVAPWITSVGISAGAGTDYVTYVRTGDGKQYEGARMCSVDRGNTMYPLVMIQEVTTATDPKYAGACAPQFMNPDAVKGKIVLCNVVSRNETKWKTFDALGIAGLIFHVDASGYAYHKEMVYLIPDVKTPVIALVNSDFQSLVTYYLDSKKTGKTATANFAKTIMLPDTPPRSAMMSARGPNLVDMNILKPDISAPGVNLIAAVSGDNPAYNAKSGSSMSAPFLSGIAAYIKSFHPTWSPAAIKSALMTTATPMTDPFKNASELAYGTGQVDPLRAVDPGLVYDIGEKDYIKYMCQYTNGSEEVMHNVTRLIANKKTSHNVANITDDDCAKIPIETNWQLNYPAFTIPVFSDQPFVKVFQRTVTHVGNSSTSNYKAVVSAPKTLVVKVEPSVLAFTQVGQALSYTLTVEGILPSSDLIDMENVISAYLVWTDGSHQVRSPIVVFERPADMVDETLKTIGILFKKSG